MNSFTERQAETLRAILSLWPDKRVTLVGASALGCFMDMRWRMTYDLDLSVSLSIEDASSDLDKLSGWTRHPTMEHEWTSPGNVKVDIIPAAPELLEAGRVIWPQTGVVMSLVGFRLVFEYSQPIGIAPDVTVQVAPIPVVTVLKMCAYLERPIERRRDLADLAYILEDHLPPDAEERFSEEVYDLGLTYEETSAFVLGKNVGALLNDRERKSVYAFLSKAQDENEPLATQTRMASLGPPGWNRDPHQLLLRIGAFKLGIDGEKP